MMADEMKSHLERLEENMRGSGEPPEQEETEDGPVISADDADDTEDEIDVAPQARESRSDRRRNRFREANERAAEAQRRYEESVAELATLRERTRILEGSLQSLNQQKPQGAPEDSVIEQSYREDELLEREYGQRVRELAGKAMPTEEYNGFKTRARDIADRRENAKVNKILRERGIGPATPPATQALMAKHADVFSVPAASKWVEHGVQQEIAKGRQMSMELIDEVMDKARSEFKLGRRKEDPSLREKLSGSGKGAARQATEKKTRTLTMTATHRRMANARFPYIKDEKKRYEAYVKDYYSGDEG